MFSTNGLSKFRPVNAEDAVEGCELFVRSKARKRFIPEWAGLTVEDLEQVGRLAVIYAYEEWVNHPGADFLPFVNQSVVWMMNTEVERATRQKRTPPPGLFSLDDPVPGTEMHRHEVERGLYADPTYEAAVSRIEVSEIIAAIAELSEPQRCAVVGVGIDGFSCCQVGLKAGRAARSVQAALDLAREKLMVTLGYAAPPPVCGHPTSDGGSCPRVVRSGRPFCFHHDEQNRDVVMANMAQARTVLAGEAA